MSDIEENTELDGFTPYVFATGTSPRSALRAQAAIQDVFGACELKTREEDEYHDTRGDWGFGVTELSRQDPIEGPLQESLEEFDQDAADLARGSVSALVEPFSFIIVGISFLIGAVASGFGQRAGEDLYDAAKARLGGRSSDAELEPDLGLRLARVFEGRGQSYTQTSLAGGPIFLRVNGSEVTFLCEPDLPDAAVRAATRLVLRDDVGPEDTSRPLRWSARAERWEPLPDGWAKKKAMRKLNRELSARAKAER